eukprot:gnl/TRDRNA2_/TRDRNA2_36286_c0_seq1.p1 gnl/TRDRNA2_/TRDRNA2_36286_c0~~gnl/TRDRNA2_/TRDRNA2_36286_c0_seq1.p1  ORF type:complete len:377 (-),score=73.19 gnl/TRDRNA2_/TRDRNA2_36286_c0_seq1:128-1258(-)
MAQPLKGHGVVVREYNKLAVEELTFLPPGPGEVRLKVHACGLCMSDVSAMAGKIGAQLPFVLGHEGAGVIEAVGEGVSNWKVGDRTILTLVNPCNRCVYCMEGRQSLCTKKVGPKDKVFGHDGKKVDAFAALGCMAEYAVVHSNSCIPVVDDMPLAQGALVSCGVTTGAGAVMNRAKLRVGSSCCVFGCGGVGLSAIQGARMCGAKQIIAVDMLPSKLEAARRFGATHVINAKEAKNVAKEVVKLSAGGVDYGLDCIGIPKVAQDMINGVKPGGTAVMVGVHKFGENITFNANMPIFSEKIITGSFMGSSIPSHFVPLLVELYKKGDLKLDELISRYYKINDAQAAFDDLAAGSNLRGVIVMNDLAELATGVPAKL